MRAGLYRNKQMYGADTAMGPALRAGLYRNDLFKENISRWLRPALRAGLYRNLCMPCIDHKEVDPPCERVCIETWYSRKSSMTDT